MYDLHLSAEQLEIRDTVRDFVTRQVKPVVLKADRLDACDRRPPMALYDQASQLGLRPLMLAEDHGGAGADLLTACIVVEELAAGDADMAAIFAETARLAKVLVAAMNPAQRDRWLPQFLADDRCQLAFAADEAGADASLGLNYHRPTLPALALNSRALLADDGGWIINGVKPGVANAAVAGCFVVTVNIAGAHSPGLLTVPRDTPGLAVRSHERAWRHGICGDVTVAQCRVPADSLLADEAATMFGADAAGPAGVLRQAVNLGIGRAAYEAALDYARLRVQGGRPILEHQAIGAKLAGIAVRLDVARAAVWRAAWACDHPDAFADRSLPDLPLHTIAEAYTGPAMLEAAKDAAEIFGAMGVMRDLPMQKYVHDARVGLHGGAAGGNRDAALRIAEALAGYGRAAPVAVAAE